MYKHSIISINYMVVTFIYTPSVLQILTMSNSVCNDSKLISTSDILNARNLNKRAFVRILDHLITWL